MLLNTSSDEEYIGGGEGEGGGGEGEGGGGALLFPRFAFSTRGYPHEVGQRCGWKRYVLLHEGGRPGLCRIDTGWAVV